MKTTKTILLIAIALLCTTNLSAQTYRVGDKISLDGYSGYTVCYVDNSGQHGWAMKSVEGHNTGNGVQKVQNNGWRLPNRHEMIMVYGNRDKLGLYAKYWTGVLAQKIANYKKYYALDFYSGEWVKADGSKNAQEGYYYFYIKNF